MFWEELVDIGLTSSCISSYGKLLNLLPCQVA